MWPGYTCQVKCLNDGIFLNVDSSTKFLQQRTVLDVIRGMTHERYSNQEINDHLCPKWSDSASESSRMSKAQSDVDASRLVVITNYNSASYQIEEIMWDLNPYNKTFIWKQRDPSSGVVTKSKVTLAEYMVAKYSDKTNIKNIDKNQPLLRLS